MSTSANTNTLPRLPYEKRHWPIEYFAETNGEQTVGEVAYPINWNEIYNLKGRLLTLVDATFTDPEQRKAMKDIVWVQIRDWMGDIESSGESPSVKFDFLQKPAEASE